MMNIILQSEMLKFDRTTINRLRLESTFHD
jgi:hypothetical protein